MARNVDIVCKYFQVRERVNGEITNNTYDLRAWMLNVNQMNVENRCKDVNGVKGRLENLAFVNEEV